MKLLVTKNYLVLIDETARYKNHDFITDGKYVWEYVLYSTSSQEPNPNYKVLAYHPLTTEVKGLNDLPLLPDPFRFDEENFIIPIGTLYTIYIAGFSHGVNEGPFPKHGTFQEFHNTIEGKEVRESKSSYDIANKIVKADNLFTYDDLQTAFSLGRTYEKSNHESTNQLEIVDYLKSLKYPKEFIPEIFYRNDKGGILSLNSYDELKDEEKIPWKAYLKSNNNSEGQEVLEGQYKH